MPARSWRTRWRGGWPMRSRACASSRGSATPGRCPGCLRSWCQGRRGASPSRSATVFGATASPSLASPGAAGPSASWGAGRSCCMGRPLGRGRVSWRGGEPSTRGDARHAIQDQCRSPPPYSKQRHRVINWAEYDAGLRTRGSLTVWFTTEAIEGWCAEARTGRGGQPKYSNLAIATALMLRAVFRLALRQTEGLIGSILKLLGLDLAVPDHSTLSRRAATLEVPRPCPSSRGPVHLLV